MPRFLLLPGPVGALLAAGGCARRPEDELTQSAVRNDVAASANFSTTAHPFISVHRARCLRSQRVRTLTLIEPPAFWLLPNHGYDDTGAREVQELLSS